MRNESYEAENTTWNRVSKGVAKKAFDKGTPIALCPVNINTHSPWVAPIVVTNTTGKTFESVVNVFEIYNCQSAETGRYAKFFVAA